MKDLHAPCVFSKLTDSNRFFNWPVSFTVSSNWFLYKQKPKEQTESFKSMYYTPWLWLLRDQLRSFEAPSVDPKSAWNPIFMGPEPGTQGVQEFWQFGFYQSSLSTTVGPKVELRRPPEHTWKRCWNTGSEIWTSFKILRSPMAQKWSITHDSVVCTRQIFF